MARHSFDRRTFIKTAALATAALAAGSGSQRTAGAQPTEQRKVPRRKLGATGVDVPILQVGCGMTIDEVYDKRLHYCYREGVNSIDSALSYGWGRSHAGIANFIEQIGERKKLWIASGTEAETDATLAADIDRCLEGLRTDYLDLYFMHQVSELETLGKPFIRVGEKLKNAGKTRFFGFTCHGATVVELMNRAADSGGFDAIMFRYNFGRYGDVALNKAIDRCKRAGIGLLAMKVMRSVPSSAEAVVRFQSENFTLAQAKLKSVWADERIDAVISEMSSMEQARENIAAAKSAVGLSAGEMHQLNRLAALTAHLHCEGCTHICEPLIAGRVNVGDALRFLMYHESYGDTERARWLYNALPPEARKLEGIHFHAAMAVCPQGIDIAGRLQKAKRELELPA